MKKEDVKEVTNELIGWEGNKIVRTIKGLAINPGQVILEYCNGERQKYLSPVTYFFGVTGVMLYFQSISGLEQMAKNAERWKNIFLSFGINLATSKIDNVTYVVFNPTFLNLLYLPLSFVATWFVFKKYNQSFKDNSWFVLYTAAQSSLFLLPGILTFWISKNIFSFTFPVFTFLTIVYVIWAAKQFYRLTILRSILLNLFKLILFAPFTYVLLGIVIFLVYHFS